jgi:hypothetical protein
MRRWVGFRGPLLSETEFRHHLLVVLLIHNLPARMCIGRTAGRCCRNSILDRSGPWKPTSSTHQMTEESTKQMTWHKNGKRYNPDKMVHPSDGNAWTHFDSIHRVKAEEARNVRVALAIDGFNPYGLSAASYTCWPVFVIPLNLPPSCHLSTQERIFVADNS